jgi:hypothetical protein
MLLSLLYGAAPPNIEEAQIAAEGLGCKACAALDSVHKTINNITTTV